MYTVRNFKSKKALKDAVQAWNDYKARPPVSPLSIAAVLTSKDTAAGHAAQVDSWLDTVDVAPRAPCPVTYYQPGPFGGNEPRDGTIYVEGPHFPEAHKFYAQCECRDGVIVKVK